MTDVSVPAKSKIEGFVKERKSDLLKLKGDYYLERRYPAFGNLVPREKPCC
jgi:hypothetical protein